MFFLVFQNFDFFWLSQGYNSSKWSKMRKNSVWYSVSWEPYIKWFPFLVHMCKMISPGIFFHFFKILILQVVSGVKGHKMAQNEKKVLPVLFHISGTIHPMRLPFMLHMYKMIISPGVFYFFKNLVFWGSKSKKWPKMTKNCLVCLIFQEPSIIWS